MSQDLKNLLKQPSSSLKDFSKKIEEIQRLLQQASQAIDLEDQKTAQKIIAIGGALQAYTKKIAQHASVMKRSNNPNLDKAVRQEIAAFCQSVCNITQIDLTTDEGKKEFLALTGLEQTALPKTEGIVIDVNQNANPPPQLADNIDFLSIYGIILTPDLRAGPQTGSDNGWQEAENQYRLNYVLAYLGERDIRYDPTLFVIGEDPRQYDHMREESYVVVTILDEEGTPKAQLFVNNYSGEAIFVVAPPLTNDDLTTGKKALQALNNTTKIPFDKQGRWTSALYNSIRDILTMPDTIAEEPSSPIAVTNDGPPLSRTDVKGKNGKIINAFLDNPEETAEALRKAFTEAFGKLPAEITKEELKSNRPVTITLPDGENVGVLCYSLYRAFNCRSGLKPLLAVLQNPTALAKDALPKLLAPFLARHAAEEKVRKIRDRKGTSEELSVAEKALQKASEGAQEMQRAIRDAVKNVEKVFPTDAQGNPKINKKTIANLNPLLTIKIPETSEIGEIYASSVYHGLRNDLPEALRSPLSIMRGLTNKERTSLLLGALRGPDRDNIILDIRGQISDISLDESQKEISLPVESFAEREVSIPCCVLYRALRRHSSTDPKIIPTLTQIRDGTYQKTAADAAASGTPPQAQEIDPTHTIFSTNRDR